MFQWLGNLHWLHRNKHVSHTFKNVTGKMLNPEVTSIIKHFPPEKEKANFT